MSEPIWRLGQVLQEATRFLESKSIESSRLNAERLLAHVLDLTRMDLYLQFDKPLNQKEREGYKSLLRRRVGREPLQYILGETEFMSLPFKVTPDVLIPRPETELLVEKVAEQFGDSDSPHILDIGTGSGCIAISLAHRLPNARITGVDVSEAALKMAAQNAGLNRVDERITFQILDILQEESGEKQSEFDVIVSNPPYIALAEWEDLQEEVREFEPRISLCDEGDGLGFYRHIASRAPVFLKPKGRIYLEIGYTQSAAVQTIFEEAGFLKKVSYPDLNGIERVLCFQC